MEKSLCLKQSKPADSGDGCVFCKTFDFSTASPMIDSYGTHIKIAICNTRFPREKQFNYCPVCGRQLQSNHGFIYKME